MWLFSLVVKKEKYLHAHSLKKNNISTWNTRKVEDKGEKAKEVKCVGEWWGEEAPKIQLDIGFH